MASDPVEHCVLPTCRTYNEISFPLCIKPTTEVLSSDPLELAKWAASESSGLESLVKRHGAILLRGFGASLATPESFCAFIEDGIQLPNFPYALGNAVRTAIVRDRVFTANESPPDKPIPWHHELAQTPVYPERILFYCDFPASQGGETPILLSTAVYANIEQKHPDFLEKLGRVGVVYSRIMTAHDRPSSAIGRGWWGTFGAKTKEEAEKALSKRGYNYEWLPEDKLREISPVLDAVKKVQGSGKHAFFNQMVAVWNGWKDEFNTPEDCVRFGDGSKLDPVVMGDVTEILDQHKVSIPWEKGDILYIDNMQVQHSRAPFVGKRKVLASLANAPLATV